MGGKNMSWQFNLYDAMKDSNSIVYQDTFIVIIRDKYPKSQYHFLVLPKAVIKDLRSLTRAHIQLLKHMEIATEQFIRKFPGQRFWWGFHAKPTMVQLHLHVISDDFRGTGLKTAKHWNSFTTSFFIPLTKVINDLERQGHVVLSAPAVYDQILRVPLMCHKCGHRPINLPTLKVHLLSHLPV